MSRGGGGGSGGGSGGGGSGGGGSGGGSGASQVAQFNRETYSYSSTLSTSAEANRYQIMVLQSTNYAMVPLLHAANPNLKILMYMHPWLGRVTDPSALSVCTSVQDDFAHHPDWFLHDQNGNPIEVSNQNYLMDIGNAAYQQACVSHANAMAKQYGFDGVMYDGIVASLQWELPAGISVPEYPTNTSWQNATTTFVNYAGPATHAQGLLVIGNMCGTTLTPGLWQLWTTPFDGGTEESWTDGGQGLAQQVQDWPKKLANVAWSEANGKYALVHSYNSTETGDTYGLASLLLVAGGWSSYSTSNIDYTSSETWWPEYNTAELLGAPQGAYTQLGNGVYERVFANGIVLVNPTLSSIPSFSLGGGTYSGSGLTNVTSVSMGATSGLILLRVS
jgi:hypothetical protein